MKICFVILHYMSLQDTLCCINSIKENVDYSNYSIIVVDNGSTNQSGIELQHKFKNDNQIRLIILNENIGFAKGNNIGYQYAKEEEKASLIVILNSDTVITDKKFVFKIIESYNNNKFALLGPDIQTPDGNHQNPFRITKLNRAQIKKRIRNKYVFLIYYRFKRFMKVDDKINILENLFEKQSKKNRKIVPYNRYCENIVLQGACIVYSDEFIKYEKNAFSPDTFMYGEEDLLAYYCQKKKYKVIYDPKIKILHMDGMSTKKSCSDKLEKKIFFTKYTLEGAKILLHKMDSKTR